MPFWGLLITSTGFFIPTFLARKSRQKLDAIASATLGVSSVLFHSTLHPTIKVIDMTIAHSVGVISLIRSTRNFIKRRRTKDALGIVATPTCAMIFYGVSKGRSTALAWAGHMSMHITAITYWVFYLI